MIWAKSIIWWRWFVARCLGLLVKISDVWQWKYWLNLYFCHFFVINVVKTPIRLLHAPSRRKSREFRMAHIMDHGSLLGVIKIAYSAHFRYCVDNRRMMLLSFTFFQSILQFRRIDLNRTIDVIFKLLIAPLVRICTF